MKNSYEIRGDKVYIELFYKGKTFEAIIDVADFEKVNSFPKKWYPRVTPWGVYVDGKLPRKKGEKLKSIRLHRFILNAPDGMEVDHIDRNPLNNSKSNLRLVTRFENQQNLNNKPGRIRGLSWVQRVQAWKVRVRVNNVVHNVGYFKDKKEAESAAKEARSRLMPFSEEALEMGR